MVTGRGALRQSLRRRSASRQRPLLAIPVHWRRRRSLASSCPWTRSGNITVNGRAKVASDVRTAVS
jgi:hypothetical protein